MFHLFNAVYLDFDFNFEPYGKDFVLASDIFGNKPMVTVQNNETYKSQPSFEDLINEVFKGNKEEFWKDLVERHKKVIVYVKPEQLYKLQLEYLKSIFKHAECKDLYKIHVSFVESARLRSYFVNRKKDVRKEVILDSINALSYDDFEELYNATNVSKVLQRIDKTFLSFEYLLADYVYNKNTKYKPALLDKIEVITWDNWFDELEQLRYEILFGSLDLSKLDPNLDLQIGTIEEQLAQSETLKWTVDKDFAYNRRYIKTNYDHTVFTPLWEKIYDIYSAKEDMSELNDLINNNKYEQLLIKDIDRGFGCIYTGEMFKERSNHVFATYCYRIARSEDKSPLAAFRLDDTVA